jgi:hypothetical protein
MIVALAGANALRRHQEHRQWPTNLVVLGIAVNILA